MRLINRFRIRLALRKVHRVPLVYRRVQKQFSAAIEQHFNRPSPPWSPQGWRRPIPHGAHYALWEEVHVFAPGGKPKRDPYAGLCHGDPPLSLRCPICEADQAPIHHSGETRKCVYCGLTMKTHGSRLFWWREPSTVTVEWTAFIQRGTRS